MPEGDTILRAKNRLAPAIIGQTLSVTAPNPQGRASGVEKLDGRMLERIDTHGKNLMFVFGDLVLHSHLGMNGSWQVYPRDARWRRPRRSAWAVLSGEHQDAVQFAGSTMRVLRTGQLALDPQISRLGEDILGPTFDMAKVMTAFRQRDQGLTLGEALLDQRLVAGIGNIYKCESCFATKLSPWHPLREVSDENLDAVLLSARELMLNAVARGREPRSVYRRRGPCVRCGARVKSYGQGDANRTTWWCERCQK